MKKVSLKTKQFATGLALSLSLLVGLSSQPAYAEEGQESITLSPASLHIDVERGKSVSQELTVINYGTKPFDFIVYAAPYSVQNSQYDPDYTSDKATSDAYKWVQLAKTSWRAEPGETVKVPYTLHVSKSATSGAHHGVVFIETQPEPGSEAVNLTRKKRLGSVVYANVEGDAKTEASLKSVKVPFYQPNAPMAATFLVTNTGQTDVIARHKFAVMDVFGNVKYQAQVEPTVIPGTERETTLQWDQSPWFGLYKVQTETTVTGDTKMADTYVLIVPGWLVFIAAVLIVLGVINVVRRKKQPTARVRFNR